MQVAFFHTSSADNMPPGQRYVILYDGEGEISLYGEIQNEQQTAGRIQFDLGGDGTFWFQIESSATSNHIRNIRIVRIEDENVDLEAYPFYQTFLDKLAPFQVLRVMDWMHTNNSPVEHWEDRRQLGYYTYGGERGVPLEVIVQLANQTRKDIWVCVPHAADDNYIYQMASLFATTLDPSITIFLEYSNEVWNGIFEQSEYNESNNPLLLSPGAAYAQKARRVFSIWHEVFAGNPCRVKRVLGLQAGNNYLNEMIINHLGQNEWDFGSPSHYFNLDHSELGEPRLDLLGGNASVDDIMLNAWNTFLRNKDYLKEDFRNVQLMGKDVITYEGGQHFVGNVFGIPYDYQQAMWDAQHSQAMYDMYQSVLDSIADWGCILATNYSLVGPQENIYGSWGMLDDIDVTGPYLFTAPKYQVHLDNAPNTVCIAEARNRWRQCTPYALQLQAWPDSEPPLIEEAPFYVYPNPGSDHIWVKGNEDKEVQFFDYSGRILFSTTQQWISTDELPQGIYLIKSGEHTVKWIKI
ncbi:MAG: T9SS type A sorting domain-containing protein [Saprospiraceae bacterium]